MSDIHQIHTTWTGVAGAPYYSTIMVVPTLGASLQDCVDAWVDFLTLFETSFALGLEARIENEVTIIESTTGELVGAATVTGGVATGSNGTNPLPRTSQMLIQWKTDAVVAGRRRRGRLFLPGYCEDANATNGQPTGGVVAATAAAAQAFVDACDGSFIIYSPTHRSFSPVTGASAWNEWAVLRSRRD